MTRPTWFDRVASVLGTALVCFPLAATLVLSLVASVARGRLMLDWLLPAELLPVFVVGVGLLAVVAFRVRRGRGAIIACATIALASLAAAQGVAVLTGLASGARPPGGWPLIVVVALFAIHLAAQVATAVTGWRSSRALLRARR